MTSQAALLSRLALAAAREEASSPLTPRVCRAARDLLGAEGASITVENSMPHRITLCATDKPSSLLANLQDVLGEGPCRDAFDLDRLVQTGLGHQAASRWPAPRGRWSRAGRPSGPSWCGRVRRRAGLPAALARGRHRRHQRVLGGPAAPDEEQQRVVTAFADVATIAIIHAGLPPIADLALVAHRALAAGPSSSGPRA